MYNRVEYNFAYNEGGLLNFVWSSMSSSGRNYNSSDRDKNQQNHVRHKQQQQQQQQQQKQQHFGGGMSGQTNGSQNQMQGANSSPFQRDKG